MPAVLSDRFTRRRGPAPAAHEVIIVVRDGYHPDTVTAPAWVPVRLRFRREEGGRSSDTVLIPDLGRYAELPERETVALDLGPLRVGEFAFTCPDGRIRGKLLIQAES